MIVLEEENRDLFDRIQEKISLANTICRQIALKLGLARLKLWGGFSFLFGGRRGMFYSITARRSTHPEEFKADMRALFDLLRDGAIHPVVVDQLPVAAAREVHARIDSGGLGGKIVLLPWPTS